MSAEKNVCQGQGIDLSDLVERLAAFARSLHDLFGDSYAFHRVSAAQSDRASAEFEAGRPLTGPEWVLTIFASVNHVREFEASVFVTGLHPVPKTPSLA